MVKRIILASDRPPVELKDMPDRLITRFSCGLVAGVGEAKCGTLRGYREQ